MKRKRETQPGDVVDEIRALLVEEFASVVHDLSSHCEASQPERALQALKLADWSVLELCGAWYSAWVNR